MSGRVSSREQRAKWNIETSLLYQLVALMCGFIIPRLMIKQFGSEAYGATASISQFLGYIALLEGGISGVARAALYKPLSDNNLEAMSEVVKEIKNFFNKIGFVFIAYVIVIAFSFKGISHSSFEWGFCFWLVVVISISTFAQYFIGISYMVFLQAAQKSYITNLTSILSIILNTLCVLVLVNMNCNLIVLKFASSGVFVLKPVILWIYVKKHYKFINTKGNNKNVLSQKWVGLGQHIAYYLHSNTDIAVLTILGNLKLVAIYSVYYMVTSHIQSLVSSVSTGMEALFGDMIAKNENDQLNKTFGYYETLISAVASIVFTTTAVMIIPFVRLYTRGLTDANYIEPLFALLLVLASTVYCIRLPYHEVVIAAGHFRQTSIAAYGEAIVNIVSSILLVRWLGIVGVAIGTLLAVVFRFVFYAVYLSKNVLKRPMWVCIKHQAINIINFCVITMIGTWIVGVVECSGYHAWVLIASVVFILAALFTVCFNFLFFKDDCKLIYVNFIKRR